MKLFTRFFLILLAFAMVPVLFTGLWLVRSNTAAKENARQLHLQVSSLFTDVVENAATDMNRALSVVQDLERIAAAESSGGEAGRAVPQGQAGQKKPLPAFFEEFKLLQRTAATHASLGLISIVGPDNREIVRFSDQQKFPGAAFVDRSSDTLVIKVRRSHEAAWGDIVMRMDRPYLPVAHPLPMDRLLYAEFSLEALRRRITQQTIGATGKIMLLYADGRPLPGFSAHIPQPDWPGLKTPPTDKSGWLESVPGRAVTTVGAYAVAPSFNWIVLSLQPRSEALAVSPHFQAQAALFILLVAALALSGSLWMSSRMVKPLDALIAGAQRSSHSEFNQPVPETGWGELVLLSKAFNAMMRTMQTYQEMQVDKLLEEKAKVESLVHTIPDGIIMASFDGRILYMNVAARSILAADSQAITGPRERTVHETLREPALRDITLALMQRRKVSESREIELKKPDNSRLGVFLCRAVTVMHNQREIGFVLNLRDVTAERDLERLRDDFYHGVVHDLRGPLSNIDGFVHIMKTRWGKISEEQGKTYLGWVLRSCERLRQLVTDILDTAKIESGTMKLNLEMVPAPDFLERTQALYALQTEHIGIEIKFELLERPARMLQCDRNLIERVLMNLMGNALKFTPKGGRVTMRVSAVGPNEVEFSVADTGPGMPQNKLQVIFEKFQQLEGEKRSAGYGLGLAICKKIVELHNGRIWAESQVGKGSRFVFRLPLPAGNPAAPVTAAAAAPK